MNDFITLLCASFRFFNITVIYNIRLLFILLANY